MAYLKIYAIKTLGFFTLPQLNAIQTTCKTVNATTQDIFKELLSTQTFLEIVFGVFPKATRLDTFFASLHDFYILPHVTHPFNQVREHLIKDLIDPKSEFSKNIAASTFLKEIDMQFIQKSSTAFKKNIRMITNAVFNHTLVFANLAAYGLCLFIATWVIASQYPSKELLQSLCSLLSNQLSEIIEHPNAYRNVINFFRMIYSLVGMKIFRYLTLHVVMNPLNQRLCVLLPLCLMLMSSSMTLIKGSMGFLIQPGYNLSQGRYEDCRVRQSSYHLSYCRTSPLNSSYNRTFTPFLKYVGISKSSPLYSILPTCPKYPSAAGTSCPPSLEAIAFLSPFASSSKNNTC